jgi:threonine/homoserine/homoserine lactone efflux protein
MGHPESSISVTGPLAFLAVSSLIIMTPGQDTLLTIRNTLGGGRIAGVLTAIGVASGQLTWTLAAGVGFASALIAYPAAFSAVRLAGAVYLVILGGQSLRTAIAERQAVSVTESGPVPNGGAAFRQGLVSNLANPKMLLFFTSLLPQFSIDGGPFDLVVLGLVFCLLTLCWLCLYAVVVAKLRVVLARGAIWRALEGAAGIALVALGVRIASAAAS